MFNFKTLWGTVFNSNTYLVNQAKKKVMRGQLPYGAPTAKQLLDNLKDSTVSTNNPEKYANVRGASEFLFNQVKTLDGLQINDAILEIGCNVGRNLNFLYQNGFRRFYGIEINSNAVSFMKKYYPEMYSCATISEGSIENKIKEIEKDSISLTFTMAVLQHIHPSSNFVFSEIARITSKYLITIEIENSYYYGMFPRDYRIIFEKLEIGRAHV